MTDDVRMLIVSLRWRISIFAWWLWIKVTPECALKHAIIDAVADLGPRFRDKPMATEADKCQPIAGKES